MNVPGAFDTHSKQITHNHKDYASWAAALAAFDPDLGRTMDRVLVMVRTEFGRAAVRERRQGTDHGTRAARCSSGRARCAAAACTAAGRACEKDQLYQERDLAVTTDFRDAFAEVARRAPGRRRRVRPVPGLRARTRARHDQLARVARA